MSPEEKYLKDLQDMWTTAYIKIRASKAKQSDGEVSK